MPSQDSRGLQLLPQPWEATAMLSGTRDVSGAEPTLQSQIYVGVKFQTQASISLFLLVPFLLAWHTQITMT